MNKNIFNANDVVNNLGFIMSNVLLIPISEITSDKLLKPMVNNVYSEVGLAVGYLRMLMDDYLTDSVGELGGLVLSYDFQRRNFYFDLVVKSNDDTRKFTLDYTMRLNQLIEGGEQTLRIGGKVGYYFYSRNKVATKLVSLSLNTIEGLTHIQDFLNNNKDFSVWWLVNNHNTLKHFYDFFKRGVDVSIITRYSEDNSRHGFEHLGSVLSADNRRHGNVKLVVNEIEVTSLVESLMMSVEVLKYKENTNKPLKI